MKIIKKLIYNGKEANLILLDDNITIDIVYDNKTLSSSAGAIWKNIKIAYDQNPHQSSLNHRRNIL